MLIRSNSLLFLFEIFFISTLVFSCRKDTVSDDYHSEQTVDEDFFFDEKSEVGTKEDPQARDDYWFYLQRDPATGQVPENIRSKELAFARTLPAVSTDPKLRKAKEEWSSIGPYNIGGRSRTAVFDINNEDIIISGGVSGGLWKSVDGGANWNKKSSTESIHSVTTIAQDIRPGNTNTWYYGTGEIQGNSARAPFAPFRGDGIFKSIDNGESWVQLPSTGMGTPTQFNSQFQYVWKVVTNPFNSSQDEVYAAIAGAIVRSVDGGDTWELVLGEEYAASDTLNLNNVEISKFTDIEIAQNGIFYAVLSSKTISEQFKSGGVYRSVNGIDWNEIEPVSWPKKFSRIVLNSSKTNPNLTYFLGDNDDNDFLWRYEYLSGDGTGFGGRWTNISQNIPKLGGDLGDYDDQNSYNMVLKVHPTDENIIYLGGTNLYRSADGFSDTLNTSWIGGYDTANDYTIFPNHYVDQHELFFSYTNPDKMLSVNDGGIFQTNSARSEDINWQPLNNGIITSQAYTVGFDPNTLQGKVIMGFQDNGTYISTNPDSETRWTRFIGGDGAYCAVTADEEYVYASFQESQIYRFTIDKSLKKLSFGRVDPIGAGQKENQGYLFINPYVLDPNNNNVMYLAGGDAIWRNFNLAQIPSGSQNKTAVNWQKIQDTEINENTISAITVTTRPEHTVFYGTSNGQLFKIADALQPQPAVTELTDNIFPENGYLTSITVDRTDANNMLVAFSNYNVQSIFSSSNGGESFENVSGNLEENPDGSGSGPSVRWVDIYPQRDGGYRYFAATSTGLYSTDELNGESTVWFQEGSATIGNVVGVMVKHRPADGSVFFATHGSGAFRAYFDDPAEDVKPSHDNRLSVIKAYPNPFYEKITLVFNIPIADRVTATVVNGNGQKIKSLLNANLYAGENYLTWDGTNSSGVTVAPGLYFITIKYGNEVKTFKTIFKR